MYKRQAFTRDNIFAIDIDTKNMSGRNMTLISLNEFGFSTQIIKVQYEQWHNTNVDIVCKQLCRSEFWFTANIVNAFGNIYYTSMKGEFFWNLPNFGNSVNTSINENKVYYLYLTNSKVEEIFNNFFFILLDDAEIKVRKAFQFSLKYIGCVPRFYDFIRRKINRKFVEKN